MIDITIAFYVANWIFSAWMNETAVESDANPLLGAWIVWLVFLVAWPYFTACEVLCGRTIGKALLGIKVVALSGRMDRWHVLVRNLVRIVWMIPYLGGLLPLLDATLIMATDEPQSLGDMVAGTTVRRARLFAAGNDHSSS